MIRRQRTAPPTPLLSLNAVDATFNVTLIRLFIGWKRRHCFSLLFFRPIMAVVTGREAKLRKKASTLGFGTTLPVKIRIWTVSYGTADCFQFSFVSKHQNMKKGKSPKKRAPESRPSARWFPVSQTGDWKREGATHCHLPSTNGK